MLEGEYCKEEYGTDAHHPFGVDGVGNLDTKDFFDDFDLNEIDALQERDLSLLNDNSAGLSPTTKFLNFYDNSTMKSQFLANPDQNFDQIHNNFMENNNNNNDNLMLDCNLSQSGASMQPQLPPVVISPSEIDSITIQLEKNQQCKCKDCGKLFNSVWYLKQHAVKHSNDRPFKCKFCMKTYKFRSNLYQHKCPERNRSMGFGNGQSKRLYTRGVAYIEMYGNKNNGPMSQMLTSNGGDGFKAKNNKLHNIAEINHQNDANAIGSSETMTNLKVLTENLQTNKTMENQPLNGQENYAVGDNTSYEKMLQYSQYCSNQMFYGNSNNGDMISDGIKPNMTSGEGEPSGFLDKSNTNNMSMDYNGQAYFNNNQNLASFNCIREKQLSQEYIDDYLAKNKNRVFSCRKCKLTFPSSEYLSRHTAYHSTLESKPFGCELCPMRFLNEQLLSSHLLQHSDNSPHRCLQCGGIFRSALALRRHKEQCRQCYYPPFGIQPKLMISPSAPLDHYSYVESEDELDHLHNNSLYASNMNGENYAQMVTRKVTTDSGIGSECSGANYDYNNSLANNMEDTKHHVSLDLEEEEGQEDDNESEQEEEEEDVTINNNNNNNTVNTSNLFTKDSDFAHAEEHRKDRYETDSGFRSRLNSAATGTTRSFSPPSSSSSDDGSPNHNGHHQTNKFSTITTSGTSFHNCIENFYGWKQNVKIFTGFKTKIRKEYWNEIEEQSFLVDNVAHGGDLLIRQRSFGTQKIRCNSKVDLSEADFTSFNGFALHLKTKALTMPMFTHSAEMSLSSSIDSLNEMLTEFSLEFWTRFLMVLLNLFLCNELKKSESLSNSTKKLFRLLLLLHKDQVRYQ